MKKIVGFLVDLAARIILVTIILYIFWLVFPIDWHENFLSYWIAVMPWALAFGYIFMIAGKWLFRE